MIPTGVAAAAVICLTARRKFATDAIGTSVDTREMAFDAWDNART
jgi:hypothetical protein